MLYEFQTNIWHIMHERPNSLCATLTAIWSNQIRCEPTATYFTPIIGLLLLQQKGTSSNYRSYNKRCINNKIIIFFRWTFFLVLWFYIYKLGMSPSSISMAQRHSFEDSKYVLFNLLFQYLVLPKSIISSTFKFSYNIFGVITGRITVLIIID